MGSRIYIKYPLLRALINGTRRSQAVVESPEVVPPEGFFQHTFGRWLQNEPYQLRRRYLKFNIDALKSAAVTAVDGAKSVTKMTKFHETDFTKIFSLTLDNGQRVMARLPTPLAGPARLVTGSQVATSEFARQRLGIPVPKTLVWCSDRDETDVGAEFIIEEAPSGFDLCPHNWAELSLPEKLDVTREVWKIEKKILDNPLPAYGSIFFREDAGSLEKYIEMDEMFVVGPSMDPAFWADERATMDIDRGPWIDPYKFLFAICDREEQWINKYARHQGLDPRFHQPSSTCDPEAHLEALSFFGQVIPYAIPRDKIFIQSFLAHPLGLDGANVWISESAREASRIEITAVTDWQHAMAKPLYLLGGIPSLVDLGYYGTEKQQVGLEDDDYEFDQCTAEYDRLAKAEAPNYFEVKSDDEFQFYASLVHSAATVWGESLHRLRATLYHIQALWPEPDFPASYHISEEKKDIWQAEGQEWDEYYDFLRHLYVSLHTHSEDGWMLPGHYDEACEAYNEFETDFIKMGIKAEELPFSDSAAEKQDMPVNE